MDRRTFTKAIALAPLGLTLPAAITALENQTKAEGDALSTGHIDDTPTPHRAHKSEQEYNRHSPIIETPPFDDTLTFTRKDLAPRVLPFDLSEIALDEGLLKQTREWNRAYILRLPNDRLLHNFRVNAGLPSNVAPLGGWEAPQSELRGHFVGHYLSAVAMLYAATQDASIKEKADVLVHGVADCQRQMNANGYVSAFPLEFFERLDRREKVWAPFYTLHKIMAGLLDMHVHARNHEALDVAVGLAGWVDSWTSAKTEEHMQDILKTEFGGMNEVLYNLAAVTSDDRWVRAGDRFTKKIFFNPLATRQDQLKGLHANTHMPQVIGAARRYEISSDARFRDVVSFFWETIAESRTYVTGGSGNTESWLTDANHLALEMQASSHHQECCCAYNMMKLARHLFAWTGDIRYIEYYERNLFNHRIGTIEPGTGHTAYFLSMSPGAWKTTCTEDQTFWCCTGTGVEEFSKLNDTIYHHDANDVYVNLFVASQLDWKARGIRLRQSTDFPESSHTLFTIESSPPETWTLYLRVPAWATNENSIRINGALMPLVGSPGSYLAIRRFWKPGDQIEFVIPMRLSMESTSEDAARKAFLFGPIVLAGEFPRGEIDSDLLHNQGPEIQELPDLTVPVLASQGLPLAEWLEPIEGKPLAFRAKGQLEEVTLEPLYKNWQRFSVYFKTA